MRRRLYISLPNGGVVSLYRISRTSNGLYVVGTAGRAGAGQHLSDHESGICFDHAAGERVWAKRPPLSGDAGTSTILLSHVIAHRIDAREAVGLDEVRAGDIVVDRPGDVGIEMILSDTLTTLPARADRPGAELHQVPMAPRLLIEIFDITGALGPERYTEPAGWERPYLHAPFGPEKFERMVIPIYRVDGPDAAGEQFLDE